MAAVNLAGDSIQYIRDHLIAGEDRNLQALRQLQEMIVELLRLPCTVPKVAVSIVPSHAHLARLQNGMRIETFTDGE